MTTILSLLVVFATPLVLVSSVGAAQSPGTGKTIAAEVLAGPGR
jgi:hypothetical protein